MDQHRENEYQEINEKRRAVERAHPQADWTRDNLMTRAAQTALDNTLARKYDDKEDVSDLQLEAMWKAYARAHC